MTFTVPDSLAWTIALFVVGLVLICVAGDRFVDASIVIATKLNIPKIVVGATIVSVGTTLPEVLVSATAAIKGSTDIAVGNALGSIICNTAFIAGLGQLLRPTKNADIDSVKWRLWYFFAAMAVFAAFGIVSGNLGRVFGIVMLCGFGLYAYLSIKKSNRLEEPADTENLPKTWVAFATLVVTAALLFVGAKLLVENGQLLAAAAGVPERVIAVTFIALGTSLPELVTTITSIIKKQEDVGLGNIIGANLFNLLLVLGISSTISGDVAVQSGSLMVDTPLSAAVMLVLCLPIVIRKKGSRTVGGVLLAIYFVYSIVLFMQ